MTGNLVDAVVQQRAFASTTAKHVVACAPPATTHPRRAAREERTATAWSVHTTVPERTPCYQWREPRNTHTERTTAPPDAEAKRSNSHGQQQRTTRGEEPAGLAAPPHRAGSLSIRLERCERTLKIRQLRRSTSEWISIIIPRSARFSWATESYRSHLGDITGRK